MSQRRWECPSCNRVFCNEGAVNQHLRDKHQGEDINPIPSRSNKNLRVEIRRLRKALAFYANRDNWSWKFVPIAGGGASPTASEIDADNKGETARVALKVGAQ